MIPLLRQAAPTATALRTAGCPDPEGDPSEGGGFDAALRDEPGDDRAGRAAQPSPAGMWRADRNDALAVDAAPNSGGNCPAQPIGLPETECPPRGVEGEVFPENDGPENDEPGQDDEAADATMPAGDAVPDAMCVPLPAAMAIAADKGVGVTPDETSNALKAQQSPREKRGSAGSNSVASLHAREEAAVTVRIVRPSHHGDPAPAAAQESVVLPALQARGQQGDGNAAAWQAQGAIPESGQGTETVPEEDLPDGGADIAAFIVQHGSRANRSTSMPSTIHMHDRSVEQAALRQVAEVVNQSRAAGGATEILLSGGELGRLHMTVVQEGGNLAVTLTAERPDTLDLLRRNIDLLAQDLQDMGFQSPNFSFRHGAGQGAADLQADPDGAMPEATRPPGFASRPPIQPLLHAVQPESASAGGLDLRL